jgi:hypothetical protein
MRSHFKNRARWGSGDRLGWFGTVHTRPAGSWFRCY